MRPASDERRHRRRLELVALDVAAREPHAALLAISLLAAACGTAPPATPSATVATLAPTLAARTWQAQVVRAPDRVAFAAAAQTATVRTGAKTAWIENRDGRWLPAEGVDDTNRLGLVGWQGKLVSWADGGMIQTSGDGTSWVDATVQPDAGNPAALVPFGHQLVLLGEGTGRRVGAWRSADGSTWTRVEGSPRGMWAGASVAPRGLVAVGWTDAGAAAWITGDALSWTRLSFPGPPAGSTSALSGVAAGEGRVVAIGDVDGAAAAWSSADLESWTRSAALGGEDAFFASVVYGNGLFVIAGRRHDRPVIWASADGSTWTSVALPVAARVSGEVSDVIIEGSRLVAFGWTTEEAGNGGSFRTGYLVWTLDTGA